MKILQAANHIWRLLPQCNSWSKWKLLPWSTWKEVQLNIQNYCWYSSRGTWSVIIHLHLSMLDCRSTIEITFLRTKEQTDQQLRSNNTNRTPTSNFSSELNKEQVSNWFQAICTAKTRANTLELLVEIPTFENSGAIGCFLRVHKMCCWLRFDPKQLSNSTCFNPKFIPLRYNFVVCSSLLRSFDKEWRWNKLAKS